MKEELKGLVRGLKDRLLFEEELGDQQLLFNVEVKRPAPSPETASTLREVREELGDCRRCDLCHSRQNIVFGVGSERAGLLFVGEAPGHDEDLQGEPFVGKAGALLTRILENVMGLRREEVYIANLVKCRPPGNRNPKEDEIKACNPFLLKQFAAIRPRLICALGAFAAQTLLCTDAKISQLKGKFYDYHGSRLFVSYHPAFLLRNPSKKREVWEDFKLLKEEYDRLM